MKKLLIALTGLIGLTASSVPTLTTQAKTELGTQVTNFAAANFYYNSSHSSWAIFNENRELASHHYYRKTFTIAAAEFESYKYVKFYDPNNESYTKLSWGDTAYEGDSVRPWPPVAISEIRIGDINDDSVDWHESVKSWVTQPLLWKTISSGLAKVVSKQSVGFSYIAKNQGGQKFYEFSIFGYQLTEYNSWALSWGASWTNLGKGLLFTN